MKSIKARFKQMEYRYPDYSSFIVFCEAIKGQNFVKSTIQGALGGLVDKTDYVGVSRNRLLKHLYDLGIPKKHLRS